MFLMVSLWFPFVFFKSSFGFPQQFIWIRLFIYVVFVKIPPRFPQAFCKMSLGRPYVFLWLSLCFLEDVLLMSICFVRGVLRCSGGCSWAFLGVHSVFLKCCFVLLLSLTGFLYVFYGVPPLCFLGFNWSLACVCGGCFQVVLEKSTAVSWAIFQFCLSVLVWLVGFLCGFWFLLQILPSWCFIVF